MRRVFAIWMVAIFAILCGCTQSGVDEHEIRPLAVSLEFSDNIATYGCNAPDAVCHKWLEAQIYQINAENAKEILFENERIESEENYGYENCSVYVATGASGAYLQVEYNSLSRQSLLYQTQWYKTKTEKRFFILNYPADIGLMFADNNINQLPRGANLSFCTAQEAEENVRSLLCGIGCGSFDCTGVYAIDQDVIAAMEQSGAIESDTQPWTKDDACYYLIFRGEYDGMVFSQEGLQWDGTSINAIYSSRGIEYLEIRTPLEVTEAGEKMDMPSLEDAKAIVTQKYDSMILTNDITVEEISLEYIMVPGEGRLVPSWRVIAAEERGDYQHQSYLRFNALTGKQMTW